MRIEGWLSSKSRVCEQSNREGEREREEKRIGKKAFENNGELIFREREDGTSPYTRAGSDRNKDGYNGYHWKRELISKLKIF